VLWGALESLPPPSLRSQTRLLFLAIKTVAFIFWSLLVAGLALGVQAALAYVALLPNPALQTLVAIVSGIVPVLLANTLLMLMAGILRALVVKLGGVWSESQAGASVMGDYTLFLTVVAFFAPMLAISIFAALVQVGQDPLSILPLLAGAVPFSAYTFMQLVLLKTVGLATGMTALVPAIVRLIKTKLGMARTQVTLQSFFSTPFYKGSPNSMAEHLYNLFRSSSLIVFGS